MSPTHPRVCGAVIVLELSGEFLVVGVYLHDGLPRLGDGDVQSQEKEVRTKERSEMRLCSRALDIS